MIINASQCFIGVGIGIGIGVEKVTGSSLDTDPDSDPDPDGKLVERMFVECISTVKELVAPGIREYREIFFKPYRIIYRIRGKNVYVPLMVDGRRHMQSLLQRRLLNG